MSFSFAKTYTCLDNHGNKIYTDQANVKNCVISEFAALNTYTPDSTLKISFKKHSKPLQKNSNLKHVSNKKTAAISANFWIPKQTQAQRNIIRKKILTQELQNEKQALQTAQDNMQKIQNQTKDKKQLQLLQNEIFERQQNMNAISKELARI